jgi:hypothetical protein
MEAQNPTLIEYRSSLHALGFALSAMSQSIDTPEFTAAFKEVQRVSDRCKCLRQANDHQARITGRIYGQLQKHIPAAVESRPIPSTMES